MFSEALQCNPNLITSRYKLAMAYRKAGDQDEFKKQLRLYQELRGERNGNRPGEDANTIFYGDIGRYGQLINPTVEHRSPGVANQTRAVGTGRR